MMEKKILHHNYVMLEKALLWYSNGVLLIPWQWFIEEVCEGLGEVLVADGSQAAEGARPGLGGCDGL